jgi:hypothetical protein
MEKANYQKTLKSTGEIFEMCGTYTHPDTVIMNSPDMLTIEEEKVILDIMEKNRIKKLEVIR